MKEEILTTSLSRFLKYGIRSMTIQNLVSPLGISTKTVYKYFRDKADLLKQCLIVHYSRLLDEAVSMADQYPNAVLALVNAWNRAIETDFGVNKKFYHDLNYYYPSLQDEILHKHAEKINAIFLNIIQSGIKEGYFIKQINPYVFQEAMAVLYRSLTRTEQFKKFRLAPKALANQTILIYLRGICSEKGLKELKSFR